MVKSKKTFRSQKYRLVKHLPDSERCKALTQIPTYETKVPGGKSTGWFIYATNRENEKKLLDVSHDEIRGSVYPENNAVVYKWVTKESPRYFFTSDGKRYLIPEMPFDKNIAYSMRVPDKGNTMIIDKSPAVWMKMSDWLKENDFDSDSRENKGMAEMLHL